MSTKVYYLSYMVYLSVLLYGFIINYNKPVFFHIHETLLYKLAYVQ